MFSRAARRATCALKPAAFRAPVMNLTRSLARFEQEIGYTFDGNPNHHSDAEELIDLEPIVYVKGHTAICKGGEFGARGCLCPLQSLCPQPAEPRGCSPRKAGCSGRLVLCCVPVRRLSSRALPAVMPDRPSPSGLILPRLRVCRWWRIRTPR